MPNQPRCVLCILEQYGFVVNPEHFHKKLMRYFDKSFRSDSVRLAQRLIRGQTKESDVESWIWIGGSNMALMLNSTIKTKLSI